MTKSLLLTLTLISSATTLILTGCTGNNNKPHMPAPVVTPGQNVTKPTQPSVGKPTLTIPTPVEAKAEPVVNPVVIAPPNADPIITEPTATLATPAELQRITQTQQALRKVVVLLPDHPSLGDVNRDIEKGIRSAHQQRPHNGSLQLIFIRDQLPAEQLLAKAKAYAPDWIIGPLTKSDIHPISNLLDKQQILLNRLESSTNALQIGLPVEDETNQLLNSFGNNTQPIAVVASNDAAEQRILSALQQQANARNIPVITISVDKQNASISDWLDNEGGLKESRQRIERIGKLLRTKFDMPAQPRHDLQALVLLSNGKQAHNFMPAVQYHQLNWPILATSRLLPSRKNDKFSEPDFEGIRVLTPPYLISNTPVETPFEALGWDSYQLLGNPLALNVDGMTGKLTPNSNNQLTRQLSWQRIRNSQLTPIK